MRFGAPLPLRVVEARPREAVWARLGAALRTALFMAALSAAQVNPYAQPVYQRLLARGKPHKVARLACARKLIRIAWAIVVKARDFDPTFAHQPDLVALAT